MLMRHSLRLLLLSAICLCARHADAEDVAKAVWNDALQARLQNSVRGDGRAVTAIVPAAPGGATFTFLYAADPSDGFNSSAAPAAGAGCRADETLGACRKRTLAFVAAYWGSLLQSDVPIQVDISMPVVAADCSNRPPYYGAAAPRYQTSNFPNAPHRNTGYVAALANAFARQDLRPDLGDIVVVLNEGADHGCEGSWAGWWYDTDDAVPIPENRLGLVAIMLHEFGHGLGFQSGYDANTGQFSGDTPIWGYYLYDVTAAKLWKDMSDGERAASARNDPNLVWAGSDTSRWVSRFLSRPIDLVVDQPAGSSEPHEVAVSNAGAPLRSVLSGDVIAVDDGSSDRRDGCEVPFTNAAALAGGIALMDAYGCPIGRKMRNAQSQGAVAALIISPNATGLPSMYATGENAGIPGYGIERSLGAVLLTTPPASPAKITLRPKAGSDAYGAKDGCARMHAPAAFSPGSSVSHFSGDGVPTMLMQPSAPIALREVGLALDVLQDIGWKIRAESGVFNDGFDGRACAHARP